MKINSVQFWGALMMFSVFASCNNGNGSQEKAQESTENTGDTEEYVSINTAVDYANSTVKWKGEMLGMYSHEGTIYITEGYIAEEKGRFFSGSFVVDMRTIKPTDENYNPDEGNTKEKLVGHLSSPDFFNVDSFPIATFNIIDVQENSLKGRLTIKDKWKDETVENLVVTEEGGVVKLSGTMTFNRKDYGVEFDHPVKEMVISDDITLDIYIQTKQRIQ